MIIVSASFCSYPMEVVRNSLQNERKYNERDMGLRKIIKDIHGNRGLFGFYAGFKLNLFRILPNTAVMFTSYEMLSKHLEEFSRRHGLI